MNDNYTYYNAGYPLKAAKDSINDLANAQAKFDYGVLTLRDAARVYALIASLQRTIGKIERLVTPEVTEAIEDREVA
jgi:arginine decarboxylase-like protein